ncbi:hypothetical protein CC78DRAFT_546785 [Lojkania enalia]|uniref:F-box domain-containing protein n=1 Tax=Lojkania enalia TaxID=147567 RepID=A0A9P4K390_9PLEO|nr:hypothetical protein CC78DRAFT_546785 [Didymosphaeria enalia]
MESIPPEILSNIVSLLGDDERKAQYATISRSWQHVVERTTFKHLNLSSTEFENFSKYMRSGLRRCSLTNLEWTIILPERAQDGHNEHEIELERKDENKSFTNGIHEIVGELECWEKDTGSVKTGPTLVLQLCVQSCSNDRRRLKDLEKIPLNLLNDREFPKIQRPVEFYSTSSSPRIINGPSIAKISTSFQTLRNLYIQLFDNEKIDQAARQRQRYGTLSIAHFHMIQSPTQDETFPIPSALLPSNTPTDHLSDAIRDLSLAPNLTKLYVTGFSVVSKSLFWPSNTEEPIPVRPNLEWLEVEFDNKTPDGDWYYLPGSIRNAEISDEEDEDDDEEEEEEEAEIPEEEMMDEELEEHRRRLAAREIGEFPSRPIRGIPDKAKLYPFFRAVAKAAVHMPKLRYLAVKMRFADPMRTFCEMLFLGPGTVSWLDDRAMGEGQTVMDVRKTWRLYWNVVGLEPDEKCFEIWKDAQKRRGVDLRTHVLSH